MLSSPGNPINRGDSTMPGDYEPFLGAAGRNAPSVDSLAIPPPRTPFPQLSGAQSAGIPPSRTPFPQLSAIQPTGVPQAAAPFSTMAAVPPMGELKGRTPFPRIPIMPPSAGRSLMRRPVRGRRHRRRPLTPEIVIDRRSHGHSSRGRHGVITVPLDRYPTLGLRGPPRRVVEIERVRCRRRRPRRHRSLCYDHNYDEPPPPSSQAPVLVANTIHNPCLPPNQPLLMMPSNDTTMTATSALLSNLTPDMLDNLPKQTVHLEPIHLPGSKADANTELHTVIFPAEMINPLDGTLSVIQANPETSRGGITNISPIVAPPIRPQSFNLPTVGRPPITTGRPTISPAMSTDPVMQRFRELFQRLSIPQTQPTMSVPNPPINRPILPNMSEFNPSNNSVNNPPLTTPNEGQYTSANIRSVNPPNTGSYRPPSVTPYRPPSTIPYQSPTITPYRTTTFTPSIRLNNTSSNSSDLGPYRPANITPYSNTPNRSTNNPLSQTSFSSGSPPYASAASLASTNTFTTYSPSPPPTTRVDNNSLNSSSTPNQSMNSTPKSILRNGQSTNPSNITYTRLNSPALFSSNDAVRKTTRFT